MRLALGGVAVVMALLVSGSALAEDLLARAVAARERGDYGAAIALLERALPNRDAELMLAETLAWAKRFEEAEARYRAILTRDPASRAARLGLARVLLWQGRYDEASARFNEIVRVEPANVDALEGHATAAYWSGDLRSAARDFHRVLTLEPRREFARQALAEIATFSAPSQRLTLDAVDDDQPLDAIRSEVTATFFSDPLTRWSAVAGVYHLDAARLGTRSGEYVRIENETKWRAFIAGGSLGLLEFPDGTHRPIGSLRLGYRSFTLAVDHREELASATALRTHATSTGATLRWSHERDWIAAVEATNRRYFDENTTRSLIAYAVVPVVRRDEWTVWGGASGALRDTDESRFALTAIASTRGDDGVFRYSYRGEYDPYWAPENLAEARLVVAVERRHARGAVKLHADGGFMRDRGRAFGPDAGAAPFPPSTFTVEFDRTFTPYRAGVTTDFRVAPQLRLELGAEHSATVDYRATSFHVSLVRRR